MAQVKIKSGYFALPKRATKGSAGYDILAAEDAVIYPCRSAAIRTGLHLQIPSFTVLLIHSRSGHGFKHGVRLANCTGVIDSDYRGEIVVKLHNDSEQVFRVSKGDRIAQAILMPTFEMAFEEVDSLDDTDRGADGFGSTGK